VQAAKPSYVYHAARGKVALDYLKRGFDATRGFASR
jgi:hypothetical protein